MIANHVVSLDDGIRDLKDTLERLEALNGRSVEAGGTKNRQAVAEVTRELQHCQHVLDAVKVVIGDEYWSIRGV
jgi:hypothetical protein